MNIGVPKEIKPHESRVAMVPSSVKELVNRGHVVLIEQGAGLGIGVTDTDYADAGATLLDSAEAVFAQSELVVKVKEPQPEECRRLRPDQAIFTFLHLAADKHQAELLMSSGAMAIAYETVVDEMGRLPLLTPMSEVAGRMSIQVGAHCLEKPSGGKGVLLGGVPGVAPAKVVVIGGGVVGTHAVRMALGLGANVSVFDKSLVRLRQLEEQFGSGLTTQFATRSIIAEALVDADLVIGAVLIPGAEAPKVITKDMLSVMEPGSVMVDVAIDQGGCFETSRPTNFDQPTFVEQEIIHQCVTNLPGSVPRTSAFALNHATLPYIIELAEKGFVAACQQNPQLQAGMNVYRGKITHSAVADALEFPSVSPLTLL